MIEGPPPGMRSSTVWPERPHGDGVAQELSARGHRVVAVDLAWPRHSTNPATARFTHHHRRRPRRGRVDGRRNPWWRASIGAATSSLELAARFPGLTHAVACVDGGFIELSDEFRNLEECAELACPRRIWRACLARVSKLRFEPPTPTGPTRASGPCTPTLTARRRHRAPLAHRANHMTIPALWEHHPPRLYIPDRRTGADDSRQSCRAPPGKEAAVERARRGFVMVRRCGCVEATTISTRSHRSPSRRVVSAPREPRCSRSWVRARRHRPW